MHKGGADDKNRESGEEESVIFFHRWRRSSSSGASKLEGGFAVDVCGMVCPAHLSFLLFPLSSAYMALPGYRMTLPSFS